MIEEGLGDCYLASATPKQRREAVPILRSMLYHIDTRDSVLTALKRLATAQRGTVGHDLNLLGFDPELTDILDPSLRRWVCGDSQA
jgi:hypothetical protein